MRSDSQRFVKMCVTAVSIITSKVRDDRGNSNEKGKQFLNLHEHMSCDGEQLFKEMNTLSYSTAETQGPCRLLDTAL